MSAGIASWIAQLAFWILLPYGWYWEELGIRGIAIAIVLWLAGYLGLASLPLGQAMFPSYVAILDIGLVFIIFKSDVGIT